MLSYMDIGSIAALGTIRCRPYTLLLLWDGRWYTSLESNIGDCSYDTKMERVSYMMLTRRDGSIFRPNIKRKIGHPRSQRVWIALFSWGTPAPHSTRMQWPRHVKMWQEIECSILWATTVKNGWKVC